jgi:hypothetical protein
MTRRKAVYHNWVIPSSGKQDDASRHRAERLDKIDETGVRRRAEIYCEQLDELISLRQRVRRKLLAEGEKHEASKLLCQIPAIDPVRAVLLIAILQTPDRVRAKRQLWAYTVWPSSTADRPYVDGQLRPSKSPVSLRGLNRNHHPELEISSGGSPGRCNQIKAGPFNEIYISRL